MRSLLLAVALLGAGFAIQPSPAEARNYPFCMLGRDTASGAGDCSYSTYQQCQARASGTYNSCYTNPYYADNEAPVRGRRQPRSY